MAVVSWKSEICATTKERSTKGSIAVVPDHPPLHPMENSHGAERCVDCSDRHRAADYPSSVPCVALPALMPIVVATTVWSFPCAADLAAARIIDRRGALTVG